MRTDMTKLVVALRSFSNAPNKRKTGHLRVLWYLYVCYRARKMEYQDPHVDTWIETWCFCRRKRTPSAVLTC